MNQDIVFLNGEFIPINEAKISILDRAFLFADAVYEVIPVYNHHLFLADKHLERLQNSLDACQIPLSIDPVAWEARAREVLKRNLHLGPNQAVYIQISRGADTKRSHVYPSGLKPTVLIMTNEWTPATLEELAQGGKAALHEDIRWQWCYIKSTNLLGNILLMQEGKQRGISEIIMLRNGYVSEATSSNVFIVKNGEIMTPPEHPNILSGVTRYLIIGLAKELGIPVSERQISRHELTHADEIWVSGSIKEILPIIELDGETVGNGKAGKIWQQIATAFENYKKHYQVNPVSA